MGKKVTVRVTHKLINYALQQVSTQCGIALAIKNADDMLTHPRVTQKKIAFTDEETDTRYEFDTPPALAKWVDDFDTDPSTARPITFTFDLDKATRVRPVQRRTLEQKIDSHKRYREQKVRKAQPIDNTFRPIRSNTQH